MPEGLKKLKPKRTEDSHERKRFVAIVAIVCIALTFGIVFTVTSDKTPAKKILAQASSPSSATTSATSSIPVITSPPITIDMVLAPPLSIYRRRNPFQPLVKTPYTPTTAGTGAAGVVTVPPELDQEQTTTSNGVVSTQVTLEGVFQQDGKNLARITVADKLFDKLSVGDTFGDNYKLLEINKDGSATILYGDERFTVYVGQSIYW